MSDVEAPTRPRLHVSEGLKTSAKGAIKTTFAIFCILASITQNVPYLSTMSSVLTELLKIQDEVKSYKSDWKAVMDVARQIKAIIDDVYEQCRDSGKGDVALPETLVEPLVELERCILQVLETLNASMAASARWTDRLLTYLGRGELSSEVKQCQKDMDTARELFNTKLNLSGHFTMQEILREVREERSTTQAVAPIALSGVDIPAAPAIFHGRAHEVDHIVDLVLHKAPARVAVLGSGGIGKTSIALAVLHSPVIAERYGNNRFFLSCEAAPRAEDVVQGLLKTFGVAYDPKCGAPPLAVLLSHLRRLPDTILCLDNLETPWDADIEATQDILSQIADVSRLALIVTTRGADRPLQVAWTRPFLPPITPLTLEAALQIWDSICELHDEYTVKLVEAVDCVPLAVTLLAHLAQSESSQRLWSRWEREQTKLLSMRGPGSRLSSVDVFIQLSLNSPRLQDDTTSVRLLSLICALPQGILESRLQVFQEAFAEQLPMFDMSVTILKQCSLAYSSEDGFLRVLSPVRHYIQAHHLIPEPMFACLADLYRNFIHYCKDEEQPMSPILYTERHIRPEMGNIRAVLNLCLVNDRLSLKETLEAVEEFSSLALDVGVSEIVLLRNAMTFAENNCPEFQCVLWHSIGFILLFKGPNKEALDAFNNSVELAFPDCNPAVGASSLMVAGQLLANLGRIELAESTLRRALWLYDNGVNMPKDKVYTLIALGEHCWKTGRRDEMMYVVLSALSICCDIGFEMGRASCLLMLGKRCGSQCDDVGPLLQTAHDIFDRMGDKLGKARCLNALGNWHGDYLRLNEAEMSFQLAIGLRREIGDTAGEIQDSIELSQVYREMARYDEAHAVLAAAYSLCDSAQHTASQGHIFFGLGCLHRDCGEFEDAEICLSRAVCLYKQTNGLDVIFAQEQLEALIVEPDRGGKCDWVAMVIP